MVKYAREPANGPKSCKVRRLPCLQRQSITSALQAFKGQPAAAGCASTQSRLVVQQAVKLGRHLLNVI